MLLSKRASHRAGKLPQGTPAGPCLPPPWDSPSKKHLSQATFLQPRCKTRGLLSGITYLCANKTSIPKGKLKGALPLLGEDGHPPGSSLRCSEPGPYSRLALESASALGKARLDFPFDRGLLGCQGDQVGRRGASVEMQQLGHFPHHWGAPNPHGIQAEHVYTPIALRKKLRPQDWSLISW